MNLLLFFLLPVSFLGCVVKTAAATPLLEEARDKNGLKDCFSDCARGGGGWGGGVPAHAALHFN